MSRIGKQPIPMPSGVTITVDPSEITVAGSKGTLKQFTMPGISVKQDGDQILVTRENDEAMLRAKHGLMRSLVNNMVTGVSQGFSKKLEINGVGYRVAKVGENLVIQVGYSHPVLVNPPQGISFSVESANRLTVSGIDKQLVGQIAANIRSIRKPESYKGKGIRYAGEVVRMKAGKAGKVGGKKK